MASKAQRVEVGKRQLELSNLDKLLYPDEGISKAEVIRYYLSIAPTILYHIKGRPLTLIRYPDGINSQRFYQKNSPEWAPEWIESVPLGGDKKKDYVLVTEPASLIWLANLASLELHQTHSRKPHFDRPDYMVFDLDPPENSDFKRIVETALLLKEHIGQFGYHTFVKTTGGKGVHLVVPLEPDAGMSEVFEAAKAIAQPFVRKHGDETTLQIKKNARKGRILIDIYRNRTRQTIIAPYSLRGVPGAPVSMPLSWEELETLPDSAHYHLRNAEEKIQSEGDAWEGIGGYASVLHTRRTAGEQTHVTPGSPYHKSPAQLAEYGKKRDFTKTPEPGSARQTDRGNNFVIHRHHATRLHYDLRIEQDGVLRSWAVPKGLPHRPGVKRLAIQTEDHPVEYLDFEGSIPKQEYGGGDMWIFARGKYTLTKEKKNGLYFRLESSGLSGEYRMHKTSENQWLMEKTDQPQKDWLNDPVSPMNGNTTAAPPEGDYIYEIKWDGIRALFSLEDGQLRIHSRNRNDITEKFPELTEAAGSFRATCGLFDGEIVVLDETGKPDFQKVINRLKSSGSSAIQKMSRRNPVHCYIFDCLYLDGRSLVADPLARRQEWLADVIKKEMPFRLSETVDDGEALFEAAKKHHLEGIMAKKKDGRYLAGKRSDLWLKVKVRRTVDCHVIGYTKGKGSRDFYFGALHLAEKKEGAMKYRGKVGTGFNEQSMQQVYEELVRLETAGKPDLEHIPDDAETVWVKPELIVEVSYARLSDNGLFKEAVFIKMRTDLIL